MNSLDSNILFYSVHSGAPEFEKASAVVRQLLQKPKEWIIADQVLWEFYILMRRPGLLEKPFNSGEATQRIRFLRHESGAANCTYPSKAFDTVLAKLESRDHPYRRTFDTILGETLQHHGVTKFFTRNKKDFQQFNFESLNPIDN